MKIHLLSLILFAFLAACAPPPAAEPAASTLAPSASPQASATPVEAVGPTQTAVNTSAPSATAAPLCSAPAELTPAMTEGPYYTSGSPERASLLEEGMPGTVLVLSGLVLDEACNPVANAWLDFWQADANGVYDNAGYTLRGHLYTDANGFYQLETVVPGEYPGRTEHIHVKVQAPGGPVLTSQVYFPGVQANDGDRIYDPRNLVLVESRSDEKVTAQFNFIIQMP